MGYNLLAINTEEPDWVQLNQDVLDKDGPIELFPIKEDDGKHYLGINIPLYKLHNNENTSSALKNLIITLKDSYGFQVFDLYGGFFVEEENMKKVLEQLTAK